MDYTGCLFCKEKKLSKEHIYSEWIFNLFSPEENTFAPSFHKITSNVEKKIHMGDNILEGRNINFRDFVVKAVCAPCNNGWMSDMERAVKPILTDLFAGKDFASLTHPEAYELSKWAIIKSQLIALTVIEKVFFTFNTYSLLKRGFIPEGFIVEMDRFQGKALNYFFQDGTRMGKNFEISREELELGMDNYFGCCLQVGDIAFRVSFLRTLIPIYREQVLKKLFVAYPFNGKMPFQNPESFVGYPTSLGELVGMSMGLWIRD